MADIISQVWEMIALLELVWGWFQQRNECRLWIEQVVGQLFFFCGFCEVKQMKITGSFFFGSTFYWMICGRVKGNSLRLKQKW